MHCLAIIAVTDVLQNWFTLNPQLDSAGWATGANVSGVRSRMSWRYLRG